MKYQNNTSKITLLTILSMIFFNTSCTKESKTIIPDVKEHFASKEINIKEEIKNFLFAADRIPQINYKNNNTTQLQDKEPNEGSWLMEAAINVERFGNIEKDVVDSKTYIIEVSNKILPSGLIKMEAADIIIKYNQLITDIVQDEINQKVANLIDFQIIEILNDKTRIQVDVNFVYATVPNTFEPETIILPPLPPSTECLYYQNRLSQGTTFSFDDVNYTNYDFTSFNPVASSPAGASYTSSNPAISIPREFLRIAEQQANIFHYPPYPVNPNGINLLVNNSSVFIPYTNVHIINGTDLANVLDCVYLWFAYPFNVTDFSFEINVLKEMVNDLENSLPNSVSTDYSLVQLELQNKLACPGGICHHLRITNSVFVAYANN